MRLRGVKLLPLASGGQSQNLKLMPLMEQGRCQWDGEDRVCRGQEVLG